jgi:hypothetical protein
MHRGTCRVAAAAVALSVTLTACYEYRPVETMAPPVGEQVALQITDQGRVNLAGRFGSGVAEIQGRVVSNQGNEFVVNVFRVSQIGGASAAWSGEVTSIDRSFVGSVKGRQISPVRTTLLGAIGATVLYFVINRDLIGSFSGGREEEPPPPPLSSRRPARPGF